MRWEYGRTAVKAVERQRIQKLQRCSGHGCLQSLY